MSAPVLPPPAPAAPSAPAAPGRAVPASARGPGRPRRPGRPAGTVLAAALVAALVAMLFNSRALVRAGEGMPDGVTRSVVLTLGRPVNAVATALRLDRPRAALDRRLGRHPEPTGAQAAPPPSAPVPLRRPTQEAPLRLLVTGDSMIERLGPALVNRADDGGRLSARVDVRYGTGLTRPDVLDWPAHAAAAVAQGDPEAVVVMIGGNDGQDMRIDGRRIDAGTPAWAEEYGRRAAAVMAALSAGGRPVYWVGLPMPRDARLQRFHAAADQAVRRVAGDNPAVRYVDTWSLLAPDGRYTDVLPGPGGAPVLARARDGVHLSKDGAAIVAPQVVRALDADWHLVDG